MQRPRTSMAILAGIWLMSPLATFAQNRPDQATASPVDAAAIAALQAEVERLRGIVPGQAVAMTQVAYNFSNLWFAVQERNWPLAQFYLNETRVRLRWAMRITPARKIANGELDLLPILEELDEVYMAPLRAIVDTQTTEGFAAAYDNVLGACYGCHVASEKPYLHLTRPARPAETLIAFGGGG